MLAKTPTIRASESNHWYTRDGVPMYTVEAKDGSQRSTTLRDARKLDLVPSVTTVLGMAAKPALIAWMQQQVLMAALTLPRAADEGEDEYIKRIIRDSKEEGRAAADKGTEIHESIQGFFEDKGYGKYPKETAVTAAKLHEKYGQQDWIAERAFSHELGFGGKCDLHSLNGGGIVVDIKTKDFSDPDSVVGYDEHMMQLAAYRVGLGVPEAACANIFVSRSVPGLAVIYEWTEEELQKGWAMFTHLLNFWQAKTGHK